MNRLHTLSGSRLDQKIKPDRRGKRTVIAGVYSIASPSGKRYIGSSSDLKKRRKNHRDLLYKGRHHSIALQRAWEKYKGCLRFKVLLVCSTEHLIFYEQRAIDKLKPIYNMSRNAGTRLGSTLSEEVVRAMTERARGNKYALGLRHTEETKRAISELHKGKSKTPEHRAKIAAALRGVPWCLGRKHSEETKEKMRLSAKRLWERRKLA